MAAIRSSALVSVVIQLVTGDVTVVPPPEVLGDNVLDSDVELLAANNQFGAITILHYDGPCDCKTRKHAMSLQTTSTGTRAGLTFGTALSRSRRLHGWAP